MLYLWIAAGSALGGLLRVLLAEAVMASAGGFPWGTVLANLLGSLLVGVAVAAVAADGRPFAFTTAGQIVIAGVLGGFTTFSAFSVQTLGLLQQGAAGAALLNIGLSVVGGLAATAVGYALGSAAFGPGAA